jgi:hypothetical protein
MKTEGLDISARMGCANETVIGESRGLCVISNRKSVCKLDIQGDGPSETEQEQAI